MSTSKYQVAAIPSYSSLKKRKQPGVETPLESSKKDEAVYIVVDDDEDDVDEVDAEMEECGKQEQSPTKQRKLTPSSTQSTPTKDSTYKMWVGRGKSMGKHYWRLLLLPHYYLLASFGKTARVFTEEEDQLIADQ
jgi:hypothetical protein